MDRRLTRTVVPILILLAIVLALLPAGAGGQRRPFKKPSRAAANLAGMDGQHFVEGSASPRQLSHDEDLHSRNIELIGKSPKRNTTNSDMAFQGDLAFAANYNGFRILNISNPSKPAIVSDVDCRGPQNDISVWKNLVFLSVDTPQTSEGCTSVDSPDPLEGFEGIRIMDISDPRDPVFVKAVATDCGSHTHTLVPDRRNNRVLIYVSSYPLRSGPRCGPETQPGNPLHKKISIIEVPLDAPDEASVIRQPRLKLKLFENPFGEGFNDMKGCHDITVWRRLDLAAAACASEGQLWDISNPARPKTLQPEQRFFNRNIEFWHSSEFTWDGKLVLFSDEQFSNACTDPKSRAGRYWFYNVSNGRLRGSFKIPRRQVPEEYCTAHLGNVIPVRDRYVLVAAWYFGATSVVDFTRPARAREAAYYDAQAPLPSLTWASYFYNRRIYANDIIRGLDVFHFFSPASGNSRHVNRLNPQTKEGKLIR